MEAAILKNTENNNNKQKQQQKEKNTHFISQTHA